MSTPLDIAALRAKLRVYDQTLPRCTKRIVRVSNHAPDYVAEEERAEWDMRLTYPCGELEGHEGQCREGRAILGWPGFATLTALLDEVAELREETEVLQQLNEGEPWSKKYVERRECERERTAVVAYLLAGTADCGECLDEGVVRLAREIERGEHRRGEAK